MSARILDVFVSTGKETVGDSNDHKAALHRSFLGAEQQPTLETEDGFNSASCAILLKYMY